jgi:predicted aconitase
LLDGRHIHADVECLVSTGRDILSAADERGTARRLRDAGVELLTDTCSYLVPVLRPAGGAVMTDSGKWAYYAPGNVGAHVVFAATEACVASAVAGRIVREDPTHWGRG